MFDENRFQKELPRTGERKKADRAEVEVVAGLHDGPPGVGPQPVRGQLAGRQQPGAAGLDRAGGDPAGQHTGLAQAEENREEEISNNIIYNAVHFILYGKVILNRKFRFRKK